MALSTAERLSLMEATKLQHGDDSDSTQAQDLLLWLQFDLETGLLVSWWLGMPDYLSPPSPPVGGKAYNLDQHLIAQLIQAAEAGRLTMDIVTHDVYLDAPVLLDDVRADLLEPTITYAEALAAIDGSGLSADLRDLLQLAAILLNAEGKLPL
jgi:hypothetical protein